MAFLKLFLLIPNSFLMACGSDLSWSGINPPAAFKPVTAQEFTQTIRELASGLDAGTREQAAAQHDVVQRLDTVKQVLTTQGENLPDDIRQQYTQLAQACLVFE